MKVIGVFGGSFNPIHTGHLNVVENVLSQHLADEVWLLPCRQNPLKQSSDFMTDEERMGLVRKAVEFAFKRNKDLQNRICVESLELEMPAPSYTWKTMKALSERYPDCKFKLIMGADSWENFDKWKRHDWLAENYGIIVYPRPGVKEIEGRPGMVLLRNVREIPISSTQLRAQFFDEEMRRCYMPWLTAVLPEN